MDCEQFTRKLGENPSSQAAGFIRHTQHCQPCRQRYREQLAIERQLRQVTGQVRSNPLKARITAAFAEKSVSPQKKTVGIGAAAGLLTAMAVSVLRD